MKSRFPLAGLLALGAGVMGPAAARADSPQPLPTPFPEARYRQMSQKSPFAVATATTTTAAPTPGFAAQLYVDGIARIADTDYVAIKSRDQDKPTLFLAVGSGPWME